MFSTRLWPTDKRMDGRTDRHTLLQGDSRQLMETEDVDASCNISRVSGCFHGMRNSLTFTFFTKLTCYIGKCGSNSQGLTWVFWQTAGYVKTALFSFILKICISFIYDCEIGLFFQCKSLKDGQFGTKQSFLAHFSHEKS